MAHYRSPQTPGIDLRVDGFTPEETLTIQELSDIGNPIIDSLLAKQTDGTFSFVTLGSGLTFDGVTLTATSSGTVTAVSVATANGVSGISSGETTPALTIELGDITPTSVNGLQLSQNNTDFNIKIGHNAGLCIVAGAIRNTFVGWQAAQSGNGTSTSQADDNTAVGFQSLALNTTGNGNTAEGSQSLTSNTSGTYNTAIGCMTLLSNSTGSNNTAVGFGAGNAGSLTGALNNNTFIGVKTGGYNTVGVPSISDTVNIGYKAGTTLMGNNGVMIGSYAGAYEQGSNAFYIDSRDRTNTAGDKAGAILYGVMSDTPSSQTLKTNSAFEATYGMNIPTGQTYKINGVDQLALKANLSGATFTGNISTPNLIEGYRAQATAAGTTTLVVGDAYTQEFTGTTTQTVKLPTTGILAGHPFNIVNSSTGAVTVQSSGSNTIVVLAAGYSAQLMAKVATPTTAANWTFSVTPIAAATTAVLVGGGTTNSPVWTTATGSGAPVRATSPTFATSVVGSSSMGVFNTTSTTITAFGAATTMTVGGTPTTAITHNYSNNATATGTTKTVNIATGGASGSTTNINIGTGTGTTSTTTVNGKMLVAKGTTTDFDAQKTTGSINNYLQENIQNTSNGTSASSDNVCTADTGSESANFIDMGINSSTYSDAAFNIGGALDGYLYTNGGNLSLGTATATKTIKFHTGGTTSSQLRATLSDSSFTVETPGTATKCVATVDAVQTFTNKRIDPRVSSTTSASSVTPDIASYDMYIFTAQAAGFTINAPTNINAGKTFEIVLVTAAAQALTFNAIYKGGGVALPTTTVAGKIMTLTCQYIDASNVIVHYSSTV